MQENKRNDIESIMTKESQGIKVIDVAKNYIAFENDLFLSYHHDQDCCEEHYLDFQHLSVKDFENLKFDLTKEFFRKIPGYGIELIPIEGWSVKIPAYSYNNGYYSDNLSLVIIKREGVEHMIYFDITDCQEGIFWI